MDKLTEARQELTRIQHKIRALSQELNLYRSMYRHQARYIEGLKKELESQQAE